MVDITHKNNSLRIAVATATVKVSVPETIKAIEDRKVPKGDIFEFSRAAGLFGVKRTSDMIPDCHPLPVEYTSITHQIEGLRIIITVEVHTIYKTGVEVEAMHGASVTALTIYDMLKPIDKKVEIEGIRLISKSGGKSDLAKALPGMIKAAVVVCSDSVAAGKAEDISGKKIKVHLDRLGVETVHYEVIPDDLETIRARAQSLSVAGTNLLLFTGGTGLSARDVTVEAVSPLIDRTVDGLMEASRRYGQQRMPYAMLSRGVAGLIGQTLVLTLPGSVRGVDESMHALFPQALHVFKVLENARH